jgi:hypothetical protein
MVFDDSYQCFAWELPDGNNIGELPQQPSSHALSKVINFPQKSLETLEIDTIILSRL